MKWVIFNPFLLFRNIHEEFRWLGKEQTVQQQAWMIIGLEQHVRSLGLFKLPATALEGRLIPLSLRSIPWSSWINKCRIRLKRETDDQQEDEVKSLNWCTRKTSLQCCPWVGYSKLTDGTGIQLAPLSQWFDVAPLKLVPEIFKQEHLKDVLEALASCALITNLFKWLIGAQQTKCYIKNKRLLEKEKIHTYLLSPFKLEGHPQITTNSII